VCGVCSACVWFVCVCMRACACVRVRVSAFACVRVCMCAYVVCVCVPMYILNRQNNFDTFLLCAFVRVRSFCYSFCQGSYYPFLLSSTCTHIFLLPFLIISFFRSYVSIRIFIMNSPRQANLCKEIRIQGK
jgi:hypothetical protein